MKNSRQTVVYRELRRKILSGAFGDREFLPSLRTLAGSFSTSVTPIYKAIQKLEEEGILESIHGSGTRLRPGVGVSKIGARKPMVQYLGVAANYHGSVQPSSHFTLPATSDWLLWELTHCAEIAAGVAHFPAEDEGAFVGRLNDAIPSDASVIVFADPEEPGQAAQDAVQSALVAGKHVVHLATRVVLPGCDGVRGDFCEGSRLLTRYLLDRGHRNILRLHGNLALWYEQQKQQGFEKAICEWNGGGAPLAQGILRFASGEQVIHPGYEEETARHAATIQAVLDQVPITAIMAPNDSAAITLRVALAGLGIRNIEVTGYDANWEELGEIRSFVERHSQEVAMAHPPTSVDAGFRQKGMELARLAIARALGRLPAQPQCVTVPHRLVLGEPDSL